ncbi:saccharopine dehydrogenase NADP-binding domain-containing protein [Streptomyces sp. PRh5]|uniref:saccharopine dehydrogenase NADP-binding domain-containing protein n=1 Tax=Streptomyces sp. PRh5 TaxID=1158056 RepID=UPI001F51815D|nr:saccharopine dehydrogenase NADP-binding domain-containing protein [Streptomyces sp. PRh5]
MTVVLNVAGPFRHTARPLMDACIDTGVHYLDTTAEYDRPHRGACRRARSSAYPAQTPQRHPRGRPDHQSLRHGHSFDRGCTCRPAASHRPGPLDAA